MRSTFLLRLYLVTALLDVDWSITYKLYRILVTLFLFLEEAVKSIQGTVKIEKNSLLWLLFQPKVIFIYVTF